jgi:hypothetical protein
VASCNSPGKHGPFPKKYDLQAEYSMISIAQRLLIPLAILFGLAGSVRGEEQMNSQDYYNLWQLHLAYALHYSDRGDMVQREKHLEQGAEMAQMCLDLLQEELALAKIEHPIPEPQEPDIIRSTESQKIDLNQHIGED